MVVGAGLLGASAAFHSSKHHTTVLVEQESSPGYHSSGRSAAVLLPPYGGPLARALTAASREFFANPPAGFCDSALLTPRGALFIAAAGKLDLLERWRRAPDTSVDTAKALTPAQAAERVPILRTERIAGAVLLPNVADLDAAALLQGYLKSFRANGGGLFVNAEVTSISRTAGVWEIATHAGVKRAKTLVNAAGAWADSIAELAGVAPKGLTPTRRTMAVINVPDAMDVRSWPLVVDAAETFYFKPDAGRLVLSPADRTEVPPQDILPDELDVAVAIDRFEAATTLQVRRIEHQWAGLRTFTSDDDPIIGFDADVPDFLWVAGFGGFGVQACEGAGLCCEALLGHKPLPARLIELGLDLERLSPRRLLDRGR
jgi:D-arginine dehydrogenase